MRRDMDLIRELLLKLEAIDVEPGDVWSLEAGDEHLTIESRTTAEINSHLSMLYQAGFVDCPYGPSGPQVGGWFFRGLTWQAHDLLDAIREPKVWTETKMRAEKVGGWTVSILTDIAKGYLKAKAAEHGFPLGG